MEFFSKKNDSLRPADAIKQFNKLKEGEALPREGACAFFYRYFSSAGESLPLGEGRKYVIFHIENDDVIQEMLAGKPSWHIQADGENVIVSLLFKTGSIMNHIQLPLDTSKEESIQMLGFLKDAKTVRINLLNIVYGKIIKEKVLDIPIPETISREIKKAVG